MPHAVAVRPMLWLLLALLLGGCSKPAAAPVAAPPARHFYVVVSLCRTDGPWRAEMKTDLETAAAKHPELKLLFLDAQNDAARQQAQLEGCIDSDANLVIVSPKDAQAITDPVAKLIDAQIPVIVLDRAVIGDKYSCFIAADPQQVGTAAGKWLAARLKGKGKIVEIKGPVDSYQADELHTAFRSVLRDPAYRFVFDGYVDPPKVDAGTLMSEALAYLEQIDAVFAYDDAAARAAYDAAKAAGREKGVVFVGVGGVPDEGQAFLKEGILDATLLYPTGGAEAIAAAVKLLEGKSVPRKIVPETRVFTKDSPPPPGEG